MARNRLPFKLLFYNPMEEMYRSGVSSRDIAKLLGIHQRTVLRYIKPLSIIRNLHEGQKLYQRKRGKFSPITLDTSRRRARRIIEQHIGRKLHVTEAIHHKDGNPMNNSFDNLQLMTDSEHAAWHWKHTRRG